MKIQIDIPEEINQKLKIFKAEKKMNTLQETAILILESYFNQLEYEEKEVKQNEN